MGVKKQKTNKSYTPSRSLSSFLEETLQIEIEKQNLRSAGAKMSEDLEVRIKNNKRMKVHILDKIIFPSMANLVVFFEYVSNHGNLQKVFDDDIQELILGKKDSGSIKFRRLLDGILRWIPESNHKDNHSSSYELNFRAELYYIILFITFSRIPTILKTQIPLKVLNKLASEDLGRALAWTEILRTRSPDFDYSEATRKVWF